MRCSLAAMLLLAPFAGQGIAYAQDFGEGARRDLLAIQTEMLPQGKAIVAGGERVFPPGARSPYHTDQGPKLFYVLAGTMAIEEAGGKVLLTCGPAPKLCLKSPSSNSWFFRNSGHDPLKVLVIVLDPADQPTIHEQVGQVTAIAGTKVTLALGDIRHSNLVEPRKELTLDVAQPVSVSVGDDVMTQRLNGKRHSADRLVKLSKRWE